MEGRIKRFSIGEIVIFRTIGQPWWPGVIVGYVDAAYNERMYEVKWIVSNESLDLGAYAHGSWVLDWNDGAAQFSKSMGKRHRFLKTPRNDAILKAHGYQTGLRPFPDHIENVIQGVSPFKESEQTVTCAIMSTFDGTNSDDAPDSSNISPQSESVEVSPSGEIRPVPSVQLRARRAATGKFPFRNDYVTFSPERSIKGGGGGSGGLHLLSNRCLKGVSYRGRKRGAVRSQMVNLFEEYDDLEDTNDEYSYGMVSRSSVGRKKMRTTNTSSVRSGSLSDDVMNHLDKQEAEAVSRLTQDRKNRWGGEDFIELHKFMFNDDIDEETPSLLQTPSTPKGDTDMTSYHNKLYCKNVHLPSVIKCQLPLVLNNSDKNVESTLQKKRPITDNVEQIQTTSQPPAKCSRPQFVVYPYIQKCFYIPIYKTNLHARASSYYSGSRTRHTSGRPKSLANIENGTDTAVVRGTMKSNSSTGLMRIVGGRSGGPGVLNYGSNSGLSGLNSCGMLARNDRPPSETAALLLGHKWLNQSRRAYISRGVFDIH